MPDDPKRGLYGKFDVFRTDGNGSRYGDKHWRCDYFVLDVTHDPFAVPALEAYAKACREAFPALADDLERKIAAARASRDGSGK